MSPRAPRRAPVVAVELSPVGYTGKHVTRVTTPELADRWATFTRHADGLGVLLVAHYSRTIALIRGRESADEHGVPFVYRDLRRLVDLSAEPDQRGPVPGSWTVEFGTCSPRAHAAGECGEADTVLAVDGFPTRQRATAFCRIVLGSSVAEAHALATLHGYTPSSMLADPEDAAMSDATVTDWRVGEHLETPDGVRPDWRDGGHQPPR